MADKVTEDRGAAVTEVKEGVEAEAFDSAFEEAAQVPERAELIPADDPVNVKDEPEEKAEVTPPQEPVAALETAAPAIDPNLQQPGEPDEKYEQRYKTLVGVHKHDKETWETERAALLAQVEAAKTAPAPPAKPTTEKPLTDKQAADLYDNMSEEEKAELEEYDSDFDVVSKMEGIKRKAEMGRLAQTLRDEIRTEFKAEIESLRTQVAPIQAMADAADLESHFNAIRTGYQAEDGSVVPGHPDFEKYRDDGSLLSWIESKPRYMQPALKQTYEQGAAQDVVDLYNDFKRERNIATSQPPDNVVQMSPAKTAKKQALTAVTTRRGAVNVGSAPAGDYDSAFDEALNK